MAPLPFKLARHLLYAAFIVGFAVPAAPITPLHAQSANTPWPTATPTSTTSVASVEQSTDVPTLAPTILSTLPTTVPATVLPTIAATATPRPTWTPRATAAPTRTATRTLAATPADVVTPPPTPLDLPRATTLVDRVRLHLGPDENFPVVTRVDRDSVLLVTGENNNCAWLRVMTDEGVAGWVNADPRFLVLDVVCGDVPNALTASGRRPATTATRAPQRTPTPRNTPTATATPTPSASPLPPLGMRPRVAPPTETPRPQPRTTAVPRANATATPIPPPPTATPNLLAAAAAGGPGGVSIIQPSSGFASRDRIDFVWAADAELRPGQVFEVAFWLPGQGPEDGFGWTEATIGNSVSVKLNEKPAGYYNWGVWLGTYINGEYYRIRYLGQGYPLEVTNEPPVQASPNTGGGNDGGDGGDGGEPEPEPTSDPGEDCPPDSPCKP